MECFKMKNELKSYQITERYFGDWFEFVIFTDQDMNWISA